LTFQSVQRAAREVEGVGELLVQELVRAHANLFGLIIVGVSRGLAHGFGSCVPGR